MPTPLIWLALDGVGHPADAPPGSPWETDLPTLRPLIDAGRAVDTTLGVPGLPQSATGQSCWLTGTDAVRYMGEHYGPHPGPTLRRLLDAQGLPLRLKAAGGRAALLNFYPPGYFAAQARRAHYGCFPYSFLSAGLPLSPPDLPLLSPMLELDYAPPHAMQGGPDALWRRGEQIAAVDGYDLLLLDLWFSDLLGHRGQTPVPGELLAAGRAYLRQLDALLGGLLQRGARVVLGSDHGNFENLGVKGHTAARVPFAGTVPLGDARDIVQAGQQLSVLLGLPAALPSTESPSGG